MGTTVECDSLVPCAAHWHRVLQASSGEGDGPPVQHTSLVCLTTGENNQVVTTTIKHSSCTAWQYAVCLQYFSDNSMYLSNITVHRVYTCYPNKTESCFSTTIDPRHVVWEGNTENTIVCMPFFFYTSHVRQVWDIQYPCQEGYKTCYIPQGDGQCLSEPKEVTRAKHEALLRDIGIKGAYPSWQGCILSISDLGYSDLRRTGPCRSALQFALQSPCAHTTNSMYCQTLIRGLQNVLGKTLVNNCANLLISNSRACWCRDL